MASSAVAAVRRAVGEGIPAASATALTPPPPPRPPSAALRRRPAPHCVQRHSQLPPNCAGTDTVAVPLLDVVSPASCGSSRRVGRTGGGGGVTYTCVSSSCMLACGTAHRLPPNTTSAALVAVPRAFPTTLTVDRALVFVGGATMTDGLGSAAGWLPRAAAPDDVNVRFPPSPAVTVDLLGTAVGRSRRCNGRLDTASFGTATFPGTARGTAGGG